MSGAAHSSQQIQALRAEFERIRRRLEAPQERPLPNDPAIKAELMEVYRAVDGALGELWKLKDEIRQFVEHWRAQQPDATGASSISSTPAPVPVYKDRLGASTFTEKAWTRISQSEYEEAEALLLRALELSPKHAEAQALLGWAQMLQDKFDSALINLQDVLNREPDNALARINVGYICLRKGIFGEAIEHLSNALRQESDVRARLYGNFYLGLVYSEREMYEDALVFFERAIALGPGFVEAYYELGHAYWMVGQHDQGLATWKSGAGVNKYNPWSRRCLDILSAVERGETPQRDGLSHTESQRRGYQGS